MTETIKSDDMNVNQIRLWSMERHWLIEHEIRNADDTIRLLSEQLFAKPEATASYLIALAEGDGQSNLEPIKVMEMLAHQPEKVGPLRVAGFFRSVDPELQKSTGRAIALCVGRRADQSAIRKMYDDTYLRAMQLLSSSERDREAALPGLRTAVFAADAADDARRHRFRGDLAQSEVREADLTDWLSDEVRKGREQLGLEPADTPSDPERSR